MDSSDLHCGDSSVGGVPVCCIDYFHCRTVLHAGFAGVQDDRSLWFGLVVLEAFYELRDGICKGDIRVGLGHFRRSPNFPQSVWSVQGYFVAERVGAGVEVIEVFEEIEGDLVGLLVSG